MMQTGREEKGQGKSALRHLRLILVKASASVRAASAPTERYRRDKFMINNKWMERVQGKRHIDAERRMDSREVGGEGESGKIKELKADAVLPC